MMHPSRKAGNIPFRGDVVERLARAEDRTLQQWHRAAIGFALCAAAIGAGGTARGNDFGFWRDDDRRPSASERRYNDWRYDDRRYGDDRRYDDRRPNLQFTVRPSGRAREADRDYYDDDDRVSGRSGGRGNRTVCVRICDGFYFPVSVGGGDGRETCRELCPGTAMDVYRQPGGDDNMADAMSSSGRRYGQLPTAFLYRKQLKAGCTCQRRPLAASAALRRDDTLRQGDVVMTERGVHIFLGGSRFPYRDADFVPLAKARGLPAALSSFLLLIDRPFRQSEIDDILAPAARVKTAATR